jgi:A/G-specific adenine glycosylase
VVDTNIARVLARVAGHRLTAQQAQAAADSALQRGASWAWNQSMMDLGAELCRPTSPRCENCPLSGCCAWRGSGDDPAVGSAGVSARQARFEGSDRQARGRLLEALMSGPVTSDQASAVMRCEPSRAARLASDMESEGLVVTIGLALQLP